MREYLPLLFEGLIAGAVVVWGVRELVLLNREKKKNAEKSQDDAS
jgi:hypothetical protein